MGTTTHRILATEDRSSEEGSDTYYLLACAGCDTVSLANVYNYGGGDEEHYYPSPINRPVPDWLWKLQLLSTKEEEALGDLLNEIYEAVRGRQYRLAAMGIRSFLEQLMIVKVGDQGSFERNLEKFMEVGFISRVQRTAIGHILDAGHAVTHRMHKPTEQDLKIALEITESITASIFFHEEDAKSAASKLPERKPRP